MNAVPGISNQQSGFFKETAYTIDYTPRLPEFYIAHPSVDVYGQNNNS